ncbi:MAG: phenylalanine--tRNA ligase subunit beta [Ruminococcaceae bacterium]|nr:phenylalanine--tRNA ligase subunit beta [Oscillospiraceae bacterium]
MKFPINWLNDYVDVTEYTPEQIAHYMTMSGSKVEAVENIGDQIDRVVVGKILEIEKHPDADKLQICKIDVGNEVLQIVTGAHNISVNDYIPVALDNSKLPGGIVIKKGKLRGVESNGMLCSFNELALTKEDVPYADENGILIFPKPYELGMDVKEIFGLNESIIEFEITPNRSDCFSVIGLAREAAATFDKPLNIKKPDVKANNENVNDYAKVTVLDTEKCPRYTARVVKNVKIEESPKWLKDRLKLSGIRSINNIVDITNYVLLEYGQPMHAFDLDKLSGKEIVVRCAKDGEKITTLDEQEHNLDSSMLLICDKENPSCVAGVMGGMDSEITEDTKTILFESASFFGPSVRITAKKLGMRTESSARFEKGLDPKGVIDALNRACELVEQLGAGEVVGGIIDVDNSSNEPYILPFRPDYINSFMGFNLDRDYMVKVLSLLDFKVEGDKVTVPSYRMDVEGEADIAEEVARIYGYDKIESTFMKAETTLGVKTKDQKVKDIIVSALISQGLYEIMNFSFTTPDIVKLLNTNNPDFSKMIEITNPLGKDCSVMRPTLMADMVKTLAYNFNQRIQNAKFYEIANVYLPQDGEKLPNESKRVCLGMYGDCDFYTIKGAVESIFEKLKISYYEFKTCSDDTTFHPGRCAKIYANNQYIGIIGETNPIVNDNYSIGARTYIAELEFNKLCEFYKEDVKFKPLPKFPAVTRDIAMIVNDEVCIGDLEKGIKQCSGKILEEIKLFDVYKGSQIDEGKKSVAFSIIYRAEDRTLTDDEISKVFDKIIEKLKKDFGAQLR